MNFLQKTKIGQFTIIIIVFLLILAPRLWENDRFVSVDEADWVKHSANFYYALGQRDFRNTFRIYEPAVTTMVAGVFAITLEFPEYRGFGQGYFDSTVKFLSFIIDKGIDPLDLLVVGRSIMSVAFALVSTILFAYLWKLIGLNPAIVAILFLGYSPYLLGHSRLLTQEGLLSVLLLLSLVSFTFFTTKKNRYYHLAVSAFAGATACLTKSPGIIIIPLIFMISFGFYVLRRETAVHSGNPGKLINFFQNQFKILIFWCVLFTALYLLIWPSMWVDPIGTLRDVYGTAFTYATQGDPTILTRVGGDTGMKFQLKGYVSSYLWHSTPVEWVGLILAVYYLLKDFIKRKIKISMKTLIMVILGIASGSYLLMMSIGGARSSPHYIMFVHATLSLIAGLGFVSIINSQLGVKKKYLMLLILTLAVLIQIFGAANYYPYYLNYYNPILGGPVKGARTSGVGYGEVLDQAGKYLSEKPDADDLTAMSWYGPGPFSFYFRGITVPLWPSQSWSENEIERLQSSDYLVIYYQHQVNRDLPEILLNSLENIQPEHTIFFKGIEYIRIYKVIDLPEEIFILEE